MSIVNFDLIEDVTCLQPVTATLNAVGANGMPLEIVGETLVSVAVGSSFQTEHSFAVAKRLPVDCLLGADFLTLHSAVLDCANHHLSLGDNTRHHVPLWNPKPTQGYAFVVVPEQLEIPARTIRLVKAKTDVTLAGTQGLIESIEARGKPKHLSIARALTSVSADGSVIMEVMNTGAQPIILHTGTKLACLVSDHHIMVVGNGKQTVTSDPATTIDDVDLSASSLTSEQTNQLKELLREFKPLFASKGDTLGHTSTVKHGIKTSASPIRQPQRRLPVALKSVVQQEVTKMLNQGVIRPSNSPWASPVVLVRKKDGTWRFCIDFRKLNSVTHRDAYPLPRIDATLDSLAGAKFFTTLDLASGYWQVELEEEDKEKTAFTTPQGLFEFNVMPFGLTNAPATFQRLMECVLAGLTPEHSLIYLDDIIIFSATFQEHLNRLRGVLDRLLRAGLRLKTSKCQFARKEVRYLGHIVSEHGIYPDPQKIEAVEKLPAPRSTKELRQFLGLSNYYRRFICDYAKVAEPLYKLTRKSSLPFNWTSSCQEAFSLLKQLLTTAPILAYPDFTLPFVLHTDASDIAVGAVLSQIQNGREHVIAYSSRQLTKAERGYSTIEKEALAAVSAIKEFYPYLYGFTFELVTDHNPLTSLKALKDVGGRLNRWTMFLQQFDFSFRYRPGRVNGNADALSRLPPPQILAAAISTCWSLAELDDIRKAQLEDTLISTTITALKNGKDLPKQFYRQQDRLTLADGLLCRKFRPSSQEASSLQVVIPSSYIEKVLTLLHDNSGHLGVRKTMEMVQQRAYWPGYGDRVERWVQECEKCQKRNPPPVKPQAPLGTIAASYPFEKVSWDIMGPLPASSSGHKYILVVTDIFTKWVEAFPVRNVLSETVAKVLVDEVICRYGVPTILHSDQGANLGSQVIQSLCKLLGIERTRTSAYHPAGNGQVERFNRTIESMLAKMVRENQRDWDKHLPKALMAYRTALHESTGFTPFALNFGRSPKLPVDLILGNTTGEEEADTPEFLQSVRKWLSASFKAARENAQKARERQQKYRDQGKRGTPYHIGDCVWLHVPAIKAGRTKKFASLWRGPYTVIDKTSPVNYCIQLIGSNKRLIVHFNRLKLCHGLPIRARPNLPKQATNHDGTLECSTNQLNQTNRSYADVVRNGQQQPYQVRGYAAIQNDNARNQAPFDPQPPAEDPDQDQQQPPHRHSTRNRRQPDFYGRYIEH